MKADFLSKVKKVYLQAIGSGGEDKSIVIGVLVGCLVLVFVIGIIIGTSFSGSSGVSGGGKAKLGKGFAGSYEFWISHNIYTRNPYTRENKYSWEKSGNSWLMGLAPVKINIEKGKDGDYKGQLMITTLMGNHGFGHTEVEQEHTFELKNFMTSKDTLNFLISSSESYSSSPNVRFALVKGKSNLLYISSVLFNDFSFGHSYYGPSFRSCFETNPAFVKHEGQMLVFKELDMSSDKAKEQVFRQMAEKYRDCLANHKNKKDEVMYIDSVWLRQGP